MVLSNRLTTLVAFCLLTLFLQCSYTLNQCSSPLRVGAFNIQSLGQKKINNQDIRNTLVEVFDYCL